MARAPYANVLQDPSGNVIPNASITVRQPATTNPIGVSLFADRTGSATLANPLTSDSKGGIAFWLADGGRFDLYVDAPGAAPFTIPDQIAANDPADLIHTTGNETATGTKTFDVIEAATAIVTAIQAGDIDISGVANILGDLTVGGTLNASLPWVVRPEEFGAVGDLVTDDSTAIQAAIDTAAARGGTRVLLGKQYLAHGLVIDDPIIFEGSGPGYVNYAGTTWVGSRIHCSHASDDCLTVDTGGVGALLQNFQITGPNDKTTGSRTGAGIVALTTIFIHNVSVSGQYIGYDCRAGASRWDHFYALNNRSDGYKINGTDAWNETYIQRMWSQYNGGHGINVVATGVGGRISNPVIHGNDGNGINIDGPNNVWMASLEVSSSGGHGVYAHNAVDVGFLDPIVEISQASGKAGIYLDNCDSVRIVGGFVQTSNIGISFTGKGCTIVGTQAWSNEVVGIDLPDGYDEVSLIGVVSGSRSDALATAFFTQDYGVRLGGTGVGKTLVIHGGNYANNGTAALTGTVPTNTSILGANGLPNVDTGSFTIGALAAGATSVTTLHATGAATLDSSVSAASAHVTGASALDGAVTLGGKLIHTPVLVTLSNGLNSDIDIGNARTIEIQGPTGAFSLGGFNGVAEGRRLTVRSRVFQTMTIVDEDGSSTAAQRIATGKIGTNRVCGASEQGSAEFEYLNGRWFCLAFK